MGTDYGRKDKVKEVRIIEGDDKDSKEDGLGNSGVKLKLSPAGAWS